MEPFKITARIAADGTVTLRNLPFGKGREVEITVVEKKTPTFPLSPDDLSIPSSPNPNKDMLIHYDRPFDPVITDAELDLVVESWDNLEREMQARKSAAEKQSLQ